jgi:hypothetical protein
VDYDDVEYRGFIPATNLYLFPRLSFQWEYDYTDPHAANPFGRHRSLLFDSELGPIFSPGFSEIGLYGEIQLMRAANLIAFAVVRVSLPDPIRRTSTRFPTVGRSMMSTRASSGSIRTRVTRCSV